MGKYIHYFETASEFEDEYFGDGYIEPWVSAIKNGDVIYNKEDPYNGHEYVDLGLPTMTRWAACNVGASSPEQYGSYFAWGETERKNEYTMANYKFGQNHPYSKYDTDGKTVLEPSDDAASAIMGGEWCMPTKAQCEELLRYTNSAWTTYNGVAGIMLTSKLNRKTIFFPAAGYGIEYLAGSQIAIWTSLRATAESDAHIIFGANGYLFMSTEPRDRGCTVRGVVNWDHDA